MSYQATTRNSSMQRAIRSALRRTSATLGLLSLPGLAFAGPEGGVVVGGDADIVTPDVNTTTINQFTDRAIINWNSFNVGADEFVIFNQLDSSSIVLNRVLSSDPTYIFGQVQANGQVFLLNPNGLFFGEGAVLDVQGFLGTTLDIDNADFMSGQYDFSRAANGAALGQVVNNGAITTGNGGYVVLAGDFTENTGLITAMGGTAALVSGNTLTLNLEGDGLVNFAVKESTLAEASGVHNAGSIIANGGMVVMTARVANEVTSTVVNNEGLVQARSIENVGGEIWLVGNGGDVENSGTLDARGVGGDGGQMMLLSDNNVLLAEGGVQTVEGGKRIDGEGNYDAGDARFIAQEVLFQEAGNTIDASGTGAGRGGRVEVSGHGGLGLAGDLDITGGGQVIIDPQHIALNMGVAAPIYDNSSHTWVGGTPLFYQNSEDVTVIGTSWIAGQLDAGVDVTLVAAETITWNSTLGGVTLGATGSGDLSLYIGSPSVGGTTSYGLGLAGGVFGGAGVVVNPSGDPDASHQISLTSGLNAINVQGNFTASIVGGGTDAVISLPGNIGDSASPASNITVNAGSGDVIFSSLGSMNVTGNVTITGATIQNGYVYTALGGVTYNGDITGSNFYGGTSGAITNVRGITVNGNVNVTNAIWLNVGSGSINLNGSVNAGIGNIDITVDGSSSGPGNLTVTGDITGGGNVTITASGPAGVGTGGSINVAGVTAAGTLNMTANSGVSGGGILQAGPLNATNVIVTATSINGSSFIVGDVSPGAVTNISGPITVTNNVSITGSAGGNVNFSLSPINAGGNVNLTGQFLQGVEVASANSVTVNGDVTGTNLIIGNSGASSNVQDLTINGSVQLSGTANIQVAPTGSIVITGSNNSVAGNWLLAAGINQTSPSGLVSFDGIFASGSVSLHGGQVNASGVITTSNNVTITGNGSIGGSQLQIGSGAGRAGDVQIDADINTSGLVAIYGGNGFGNDIVINGSIAGNSVVLDARGSGSGGGDITVNGGISAAGPITLSAEHFTTTADAGGNVIVSGGVSGVGAITISAADLSGASPDTGDVQIGGTILGGTVTITTNTPSSGLGGRIDIGAGTPEVNFLAGNISASTGDISLVVTNGAGVINAGDLSATAGNVVLTATAGQGHVHIGNYTSGIRSGGTVFAGGNVNVTASGSSAVFDAGNIAANVLNVNVDSNLVTTAGNINVGSLNVSDLVLNASNIVSGGFANVNINGNTNIASGGSFNVTATALLTGALTLNGDVTMANGNFGAGVTVDRLGFGTGSYTINANNINLTTGFNTTGLNGNYSATSNITISASEVFTGNLNAGGLVTVNGSGATNQSIGNIVGGSVDLNFMPSGAGSINATVGTVTATTGNIDITMAGGGGSSFGSLTVGNINAANGAVNVDVFTGSGNSVNGFMNLADVNANQNIAISGEANISTGNLQAVSGIVVDGRQVTVNDAFTINGNILLNGSGSGASGGNVTVANNVFSSNGGVAVSALHHTTTADGGADINIGGLVTAGNNISLTAYDSTGSVAGANITVGGVDALGSAFLSASDFAGNGANIVVTTSGVHGDAGVNMIAANAASSANINITGTVLTPANVNLSADGGITGSSLVIDTSAGGAANVGIAGGINVTGNVDIWAINNGNVNVTGPATIGGALQVHATGGASLGNITFTNSISAADILLNAAGGLNGGNIEIGDTSGGQFFAGNVTATAGNVSFSATGGNNGGHVYAGSVLAGSGNVFILADGQLGTTAGSVRIGSMLGTPTASLSPGGITAGSDVAITISATSSGGGNLDFGSLTAGINVFLDVTRPGGGTFDVSALPISFNSDFTFNGSGASNYVFGSLSGEGIFINTQTGNIQTGNLTALNSDGPTALYIQTNELNGNISIGGSIVASGGGAIDSPKAVDVFIGTNNAGSGNINVSGNVSLVGTPFGFSYSGPSESGSGSMGEAHLVMQAGQGGAISMGNVSLNAAGLGSINLSGGDINMGSLNASVSAGTFTRTGTSTCGGSCNISFTEQLNTGGFLDIRMGDFGTVGGSLTMGAVNVTAGDAQMFMGNYGNVSGGSVTINATGTSFNRSSSGTYQGQGFTYSEGFNGGGAVVQNQGSANAIVAFGNINLTGAGSARLELRGNDVTVGALSVTGSGGTFTASGSRPFSNETFDEGGGGPNIDEGTIQGGRASVYISGFNGSNAGTFFAGGSIDAFGAGGAEVTINADDISVSGDITASATANVIKNGTINHIESSAGVSYAVTGSVVSSLSGANIDLNGASTGTVIAGNLMASATNVGMQVTGGTVNLGNINVVGSGGNLTVTETYTNLDTSASQTFSFQGPTDITGIFMDAGSASIGSLNVSGVGAGGALLHADTLTASSITVAFTNGNYTVNDVDFFATNPTSFTLGDAILDMDVTNANVTGNITVTGSRFASVGGNLDAAGTIDITAPRGITSQVRDQVNYVNTIGEESPQDLTLSGPITANASAMTMTAVNGPIDLTNANITTVNDLTLISGQAIDLSTATLNIGGRLNINSPTLTLAGGSGANYDLVVNVNTINLGPVGNVTIDNSAHGTATTLNQLGTVTSMDIITGGNLIIGTALDAGSITLTASSFNLGGKSITATSLIDLTASTTINGIGTMSASVINLNATTLNGNNINLAANNLNLAGRTVTATNNMILQANNNLFFSAGTIAAGGALVATARNISDEGFAATVTADALALAATNSIDLSASTLNIGSGSLAGIPGDTLLMTLLAGEGLTTNTTGPSAVFSAPTLALGNINFDGDYIEFKSNSLTFNGSVNITDPTAVVQLQARGTTATTGLEDSATGTGTVNYSNVNHLSLFQGLTVVIGGTTQTGDITIGTTGIIDIGATNLFAVTQGNVTGLENVLSTGIVKDLAQLLGGGFEIPQTDEIDVNQDPASDLNNDFGHDVGDDIEDDVAEEEGDEEGEDTADDSVEEEENDSLISQDTVEEDLMCE